MLFFFLMIRRPPTSTRTATRFPSTTLCRSAGDDAHQQRRGGRHAPRHRLGGAEYGIAREPDRVGPFEQLPPPPAFGRDPDDQRDRDARSEEHTSELQSLMRISYAVFCLKKNISTRNNQHIYA